MVRKIIDEITEKSGVSLPVAFALLTSLVAVAVFAGTLPATSPVPAGIVLRVPAS